MQKKLSLKIIVIFVIGALLMIPLLMISEKIYERQSYLQNAKHSVAQSWTGAQRLITPILVIPYVTQKSTQSYNGKSESYEVTTEQHNKMRLILAQNLTIDASLDTSVRYKGIYQVPVYNAQISVTGKFDQQAIQENLQSIENSTDFKHFSAPYVSSMVSDARGIGNVPVLRWNKQNIPFAPGSRLKANSNGLHAILPMSALRQGDQNEKGLSAFSYKMNLRGMEQISFIPVSAQSEISVNSNWAHPEFIGNFLPIDRQVSGEGYQANWQVSSFASNIGDKLNQCARGNCKELFKTSFGVKQIEPVSIYVQAERSVKYGVLFIGLSFIAFFIFEVTKKLPIHAIQYTLVGFSIAIFYLLLISLSEHIAFAAAYAIASFCCISLLFYYLRYVLQGAKDAFFFAVLLSVLYAVLYVIISAEDFALLMGAFLTFITLALMMIFTRNIDWYNLVDTKTDKHSVKEIASQIVNKTNN
ncbi:MAG: cell envelope integrity protein CreD [Oceanospirillaceae bacterium]